MTKLLRKVKTKKGFTLIEMLIVVAIIAVLAAILIPTVSSSLVKSREAADVASLRSAYAEAEIEMLANDNSLKDVYNEHIKGLNLNYSEKADVYINDVKSDKSYKSLEIGDDDKATSVTVKYNATKLKDGNEADKDGKYTIYSWTLEDIDAAE